MSRRTYTGLALTAAAALTGLLLRDRVPPLDRWLVTRAYTPSGTLATIATAVSGVGTILTLCMMIAAVAMVARRRPRSVPRYLALLACCLAVIATQAVFQRSGPPVTAQDWTYPSGHAVFVTAFALTAVLAARSLGPTWRTTVPALSATAVLLISASRLILGEHYLVDVVAAVVATTGVGLITAAALRLPQATAPTGLT